MVYDGASMAVPERGEHEQHEAPQTTNPYELTARFASERVAHRAYFRTQAVIFTAPCDLSVTRFLLDRVSHVAVIGVTPPEELDRRLRRVLRAGEFTTLSGDILQTLWRRRLAANLHGPWVERHHRPGLPL